MQTKQATKRKSDGKTLRVVRGIENAKGERIEAGQVVTMVDLLRLFDAEVIKRWQRVGVIEDE